MTTLTVRTTPLIRWTFTGLVAAHAETDQDTRLVDEVDANTHSTLRIGGQDVLTTLNDLISRLPAPVVVAVALDGAELAQAKVNYYDVHPSFGGAGCADGCCNNYECQEFKVGDVDVLAVLEDLHGGQHILEVTMIGFVPEHIEVEFAHHTTVAKGDYVFPGTRRRMTLRQAEDFRYRITTESRLALDAAKRKERARIDAL